MSQMLSEEEAAEVDKAKKLSKDIKYSVQDIMDATEKPYRWLISHEVILTVGNAVEYLRKRVIEMPAETIRSYTAFRKDNSLNRLEQELADIGIDRRTHRRAVGNIRRGVRVLTLAEVELLGRL